MKLTAAKTVVNVGRPAVERSAGGVCAVIHTRLTGFGSNASKAYAHPEIVLCAFAGRQEHQNYKRRRDDYKSLSAE